MYRAIEDLVREKCYQYELVGTGSTRPCSLTPDRSVMSDETPRIVWADAFLDTWDVS